MKKLSAAQAKQKAELATKLEAAIKELQAAIVDYNEAITGPPWQAIVDSLADYNAVMNEAEEFRSGITSAMDDYISERSEKWGESDAASEYENWKGSWEEASFSEVEIDEPQELEDPTETDDALTVLQELPEEVGA